MPANLDTQELDNLIEEQEEFIDAAEEFEHDVVINQSMIDWHRINFESSFGNSGEFSGRLATEVHHKKCDDCEINTKIVEKQREFMLKLDKQIQENHKIQREYKEKLKHHVQLLNESVREVANATKETTSVKVQLQVQKDANLALKLKYCKDSDQSLVKQPEIVDNEEGPLPKEEWKCSQFNFFTKNRVLMTGHIEKRHENLECLMCGNTFPNVKTFKKHKQKHDDELNVINSHINKLHQYPTNVHTFKCHPCKVSFKTHELLMDHMYNEHFTDSQCQGKEAKKFSDSNAKSEREICQNGDSCLYHKQNRCNFYHDLPTQEQQVHHPQKPPSGQWHMVQRRRPGHTQTGRGQQQGHRGQRQQGGAGQQQQRQGGLLHQGESGHHQQRLQHRQRGERQQTQQEQRQRNNGGHRDISTPWCQHVHNCLQGRFCVLRKDNDMDFSSQPRQGRQ